jgi:hypothetical protein
VDDRAAERADALDCRGEVGDGEVGQAGGVAGARWVAQPWASRSLRSSGLFIRIALVPAVL